MKTYIFSFISTLFLMFFFSCCKDKTPPQVDLGHFSLDTIKPYLYFKPGSWWVYKNDSTSEIDSQVMLNSKYSTISAASSRRKYTYNDISSTVKSLTNGYFYDLSSLGLSPEVYNWKFFMHWSRSRHKSGDFDGVNSIFMVPFDPNIDFGSASERCFYRGKLPTLSLNGFTFYDVLKFEVQGDPSWPDSKILTSDHGISTYYWAKGLGLIKISNDDYDQRYNPPIRKTQSWELINYHIEP